jgi:hypothetical protein
MFISARASSEPYYYENPRLCACQGVPSKSVSVMNQEFTKEQVQYLSYSHSLASITLHQTFLFARKRASKWALARAVDRRPYEPYVRSHHTGLTVMINYLK